MQAVLEVLVGQREAPELYALQDWASPAQPSQQLLASSNGHSGASADALLGLEDDEEDEEQQQEDDYGPELEMGPFQGQGLDLRSSGILAIYRFPTVRTCLAARGRGGIGGQPTEAGPRATWPCPVGWRAPGSLQVVLFVSGRGIATARALLEGEQDAPTLNPWQRKEVRVYYKVCWGWGWGWRDTPAGSHARTGTVLDLCASTFQTQVPNEAHVLFSERFEAWREGASGPSGSRLHVVPTTARTFQDAFDDDDTFAYDPNYTAAIILSASGMALGEGGPGGGEVRRDGAGTLMLLVARVLLLCSGRGRRGRGRSAAAVQGGRDHHGAQRLARGGARRAPGLHAHLVPQVGAGVRHQAVTVLPSA